MLMCLFLLEIFNSLSVDLWFTLKYVVFISCFPLLILLIADEYKYFFRRWMSLVPGVT